MTQILNMQKYNAYKDSGVEWLGEIPKHWETIIVKRLGKTKAGGTPSTNILKYWDGEIPWLPSGKLQNCEIVSADKFITESGLKYSATKLIKPNTVLIALTGATCANIGYLKFEACANQSVIAIEENKGVDSKFLYYALINERLQILLSQTGGAQAGINETDVNNIILPTPSTTEQTAIAAFLDRKTAQIDQAIGIKQKQIELLKERRQILIHKAVTRGLNPNAKLKDSGVEWIGEIPEGWEVKRLKYILKSQGRIGFKGYTTSDLVGEGEGALTLGATHLDWEGNIHLSQPVFISWKKYYESPEIMVNKNDIIIVQRGSTCGKVALINMDLGPTTINPSLVLLKEITEFPEYVFLGIKVVLNGILNLVSNTAIPMLTQFQINNIEIAIPTRKEQESIVLHINNYTEVIDSAISLKEQEIEKLKEYKATLINSAVTGKIKVC
jgi:type I restriction enzyme S subunit